MAKTTKKAIGRSLGKGSKPFLAARIPVSLNTVLEAHSESTGESKTDTIVNALAAYLGWSSNESVVTSASDRLSALEERIRRIEQTVYEPKQLGIEDVKSTQTKAIKTVIKSDNTKDNKKGNATPEPISDTVREEWVTVSEAYERYGKGMKKSTFQALKPKQLKERFGLETDLSKKGYGTKWIKAK